MSETEREGEIEMLCVWSMVCVHVCVCGVHVHVCGASVVCMYVCVCETSFVC